MRKRVPLLVSTVLVATALLATAGIGLAQDPGASTPGSVGGEPSLNVFVPDPTLTPGSAGELTLQIENDGRVRFGSPQDRGVVTTARNVKVDVDENDAPITVETERQSVGSIPEGEPRDVPLAVRVPEDAEPGTYEIDVELRYSHTAQLFPGGGVQNDVTRTVTKTVEIEIDDGPRFSIQTVDTDVQVGDSGTLVAEVENVGLEPARDLDVTLESTSPSVRFGESELDSARVPSLDPGETALVEYDVAVRSGAVAGGYSLDGTVRYTDLEGGRDVDDRAALSTELFPGERQRFTVDDVESTLRVGEEGDLVGTVTNTGPSTARNVVVRFDDESTNVFPIERDVAVGTLEPEESDTFRLPIEIGREAEAVAKSFDLSVTYRNQENEQRRYADLDAQVAIAERRDEFLLEVDDRTIRAGETKLIDVEVTNNLDQRVTDVEAKLFADDPLDSDDDEGYVEALEPGESTTMTFELDAGSGAVAKTYPVSMDFRYDDNRGNSQLSDTYRVAIDVTEGDDDGLPWLLVGGVLVLVVGGGYLVYRRRSG